MEIRNGYQQTDAGVIPKNWEAKKLGEIATIKGGNGFPLLYQGMKEGEYPFFKVSDMNNIGNDIRMRNSNHWIDKNTAQKLGATIFPVNSIVFAKVGAAIFLERKRILNLPGCIDNNMSALILNEKQVDCQFVHQSLLLIKFGSLVSTTALPSLNGSQISEIAIAVPPLPEQKAIAAALSDIDALLNAQEAAIAKKRDLKTTAMQQLLSGERRLPGFSGDWKTELLSRYIWFQEGPGVQNHQFTVSGIKLLNGTNIFKGEIKLDTTTRFISEREAYGVYSHFIAQEGDIVIACSGIAMDKFHEKVAFVKAEHLPFCMNTSTMRFRAKSNAIDIRFFYHSLTSDDFKSQIAPQATGSAQLNFGPSHVKNVEIKLPPTLAEQNAIAAVLSDMDAAIAQLEATHRKTRDLKTAMMQQLLTGAIRLV